MKCIFCQREIKNKGSLAAHQMSCKENPNKITHKHSADAGRKKGKEYNVWNRGKTGLQTAWNKGLTGLSGTPHSKETKERLSQIAKERKLGGYVRGSGRGKKGWYKGFFCDSSWELAYVIYCLDHKIDIKRNTEKRTYEYNGKIKNYIPDFIVEGKLVEIKGYKTDEWLAKLSANPDVKVLYEKDLQPILDYVIMRYSKKFVELYE